MEHSIIDEGQEMKIKNSRGIISFLFVFLVIGSDMALEAAAQSEVTVQQINDLFVEASSKANPSVVTIKSERVVQRNTRHPFFDLWDFDMGPVPESRGTILGSGVIINGKEGYIVTNNHVVEKAEDIFVNLVDGREVIAEVVGTDPESDIAVLKVNADDLGRATIGDSDDLRIGEWVLAIGSPFSENLDHTVSAGIVSAKGRSNIMGGTQYEDFIQTDAAINPGNSGGALVNLKGELVGINTAIATDGFSRSNAGVGFAIPVNLVMRIVEDLLEYGKVTRAYLGVYIQPVDPTLAKALGMKAPEGALVTKVDGGTPAEKARIKEGDVIIKLDDTAIRDNAHLRNVVSSSRPGNRHKLTIIRDKKEKVLTVELAERPDDETLATTDQDDSEDETGRAGIAVAELASNEASRYDIRVDQGVLITRVDPRSNAARADIRPGDVIIRVGETEIEDVGDYRRTMAEYKKGDTVLVRISRGENLLFRGLELG
jgi:serine protease Do